jgi:hypothetical protein
LKLKVKVDETKLFLNLVNNENGGRDGLVWMEGKDCSERKRKRKRTKGSARIKGW